MRILRRGEVVIPKAVRDRLGWEVGDLLVPELDGDRLVLARLAPGASDGRNAGGIRGAGAAKPVPSPVTLEDLPDEERLVLRELGAIPVHPERVLDRSGLSVSQVLVALLNLELKGLARYTPIGYIAAFPTGHVAPDPTGHVAPDPTG